MIGSIFFRPAFLRALGTNIVWINISEVARYFLFVMPMMRAAFPDRQGVAPMSWPIFAIWGLWDLVLLTGVTAFCWMVMDRMGPSMRACLEAALLFWLISFVLLWVGFWNMGLAPSEVLVVALPWALGEIFIGCLITRYFYTSPMQ